MKSKDILRVSKYYFFFSIFFSLFSVKVKSQELLPLQFKTGSIFTINQTNDFNNPVNLLKIQAATQYYFLLQFELMPNEQQKLQMSAAYNLVFAHYLPSNAFYCYSLKPIPNSDFNLYHIRSITAVEPLNKIDHSLTSTIPDHIKMPGAKLNIAVSVGVVVWDLFQKIK